MHSFNLLTVEFLLFIFLFLFIIYRLYELGSVCPKIHWHKWYLYDVTTEVHKGTYYVCVESRCTICGTKSIRIFSNKNIKEVLGEVN